MKLLENKVALITGATRGIGHGIAFKLAQHGANIAFTYFKDETYAQSYVNAGLPGHDRARFSSLCLSNLGVWAENRDKERFLHLLARW